MNELSELISEAEACGWSSTCGIPMDRLIHQATLSRLNMVPNRQSGPLLTTLEPSSAADAREQSLSASYGVGPQPLHTDGAHQTAPPDYILLSSAVSSEVPTFLWSYKSSSSNRPTSDLRNGLFTVRSGKTAFLAPALASKQLRYDPGCMTPSDARARRAAEYFDSRLAHATQFAWDEPGLVLVIANSFVLHARGDASAELERKLVRIALRVDDNSTVPKPQSSRHL
jgi:hypothetical protein